MNGAALNARCFVAKKQLVCRYGMAEDERLGKAALPATFRSQCVKSGVIVEITVAPDESGPPVVYRLRGCFLHVFRRFEMLEMSQPDFNIGCESLKSRVSPIRLLNPDRKKAKTLECSVFSKHAHSFCPLPFLRKPDRQSLEPLSIHPQILAKSQIQRRLRRGRAASANTERGVMPPRASSSPPRS